MHALFGNGNTGSTVIAFQALEGQNNHQQLQMQLKQLASEFVG